MRGNFAAGRMLSLFLLAAMAVVILAGCGGSGKAGQDYIEIRIAHNNPREVDPAWRDPSTGNPAMNQEAMDAALYAQAQVLEKFNVRFSWVPYPNYEGEDVLRSVLAGDPLADLVRITGTRQGMLLSQNVLQPLDDFESFFNDDDSAWMFLGKVYGHNYFLNNEMRHGTDAPLVYNIGILKRIPALRENGRTVLPVDLWLEGKWTWNAFEDYLQKVSNYLSQAGNSGIAYGTDDIAGAAMMAMHSNGAGVYGDRGLEFDSAAAKEAVAYIERLMSRNLIGSRGIVLGPDENSWMRDQYVFQRGESVFTNMMQWVGGWLMPEAFNERGDTIGVVPFPRPDSMRPDDPAYGQMNEAKDVYAVPRGISGERAQLAVRAFREYMVSYYKRIAGSERALDFLQSDENSRASALRIFLDISDPEYGDKVLAAWRSLAAGGNTLINEYVKNVGIWDVWRIGILQDSLYRATGASSYAVQVESRMPLVDEVMNGIQSSLDSTGAVDNIAPRFTDIAGSRMAFPAGTDPAGINWGLYLQAGDNIDGNIDFSKVAVALSGVDFARPGEYADAASFSVKDSFGNEAVAQRSVIVFDSENTVPPTLTIKNGYRAIALNEDTSSINWAGDFVEAATDKDALDIKDSVFADLSELDTTEQGDYGVTLTVRDYAGNEASVQITVTVA